MSSKFPIRQQLKAVSSTITKARSYGIIHQSTEDESLFGRTITLKGRELINLGSCSYLGLEQHDAIKAGVIDAVQRYGSQFSSSRAYVSIGLYDELEEQLEQMFGAPVLVTATTSLGHLSALPVLISNEDAVILDHQVHASVSMGAQQLRAQGVRVEVIRHSNLAMLETRLQKLSATHRHIWYFADGVYSMYGDLAPYAELRDMLAQYEQLHLYIDDAHGISWTGTHGSGTAIPALGGHPRVVFTASLNKSFAAAGGALVFPNQDMKQAVRDCGGPMIFSGPIQPPMLGAALASARLHLSDALTPRQDYLQQLMHVFKQEADRHGLPVISEGESPICFVSVGKPEVGYNMTSRMLARGYFVNLAVYPSVPHKNTGLRMTLHHHLRIEDIIDFVSILAQELPHALAEEQSSFQDIYSAFKVAKAS